MVDWNGDFNGAVIGSGQWTDQTREREKIGGSSAHHIQTPFLGLIFLHGSMPFCTSDIVGKGLS